MAHSFFAFVSRLKNITRWSLMRNALHENVQEHSHMVAAVAHALAVIRRDVFDGKVDPNAVAAAALYHDAPEILTGDLPTPVKYYSPEIRDAYKKVEKVSTERLLAMLPEELAPAYRELLCPEDEQVVELVHAADKIAAYIKCLEEKSAGNLEFRRAERETLSTLKKLNLPEVEYFLKNFGEPFSLTLDELQ